MAAFINSRFCTLVKKDSDKDEPSKSNKSAYASRNPLIASACS